MARDDENRGNAGNVMPTNAEPQPGSRDRYRDNDDVRDPLSADDRAGTRPDTRNEARGDARENVGNHSRGTAADPVVGGNDRTKRPNADDEI